MLSVTGVHRVAAASSVFVGGDDLAGDLIARGARATGRITEAQRASAGVVPRHAHLRFVFTSVKAWDGEVVRLRSSRTRRSDARVSMDRSRHHSDLQWASDADVFEAYVEGNYEL